MAMGFLSKFQERLKNMKLLRRKKIENNEEFVKGKVEEIHKIVEKRVPSVKKGISSVEKKNDVVKKKDTIDISVQNNEVGKKEVNVHNNINIDKRDNDFHEVDDAISEKKNDFDENILLEKNRIDDNKKNDITNKDNHELVNSKGEISNGYVKKDVNKVINSDDERREELNKLGLDILEKIKDSFLDKIDELEVLEGEFYLLSHDEKKANVMEDIKKIEKKIQQYVLELNKLISEYNAYKKNYYLDQVVLIDDSIIVDDLIDYKNMLPRMDDEKKFVGEYKKLEEFQQLYSNLRKVKNEVYLLKEDTKEKRNKIYERDQKYLEVNEGLLDVQKIHQSCLKEIKSQDEYFEQLMKDINRIDHREYYTRYLDGMNDLIHMSLKYMGLMILNPLKGTIPGIGIEAIAVKNMIGNIKKNLQWKEEKHIKYYATDFDDEINHRISDIHFVSIYVGDAIRKIDELRDEFMLQYDSKVPSCHDTLDCIQQVRNKMVRNQNKINKIEERLNQSKRINHDKLVKVREMNEH